MVLPLSFFFFFLKTYHDKLRLNNSTLPPLISFHGNSSAILSGNIAPGNVYAFPSFFPRLFSLSFFLLFLSFTLVKKKKGGMGTQKYKRYDYGHNFKANRFVFRTFSAFFLILGKNLKINLFFSLRKGFYLPLIHFFCSPLGMGLH